MNRVAFVVLAVFMAAQPSLYRDLALHVLMPEDRANALRIYNEGLAEICSLAVHDAAHGMGIGRSLVEQLVENGRELGLNMVFALTLQEIFFHRLGFKTVPKETFPLKVWADCRNCPKLPACDEIAVAREL